MSTAIGILAKILNDELATNVKRVPFFDLLDLM